MPVGQGDPDRGGATRIPIEVDRCRFAAALQFDLGAGVELEVAIDPESPADSAQSDSQPAEARTSSEREHVEALRIPADRSREMEHSAVVREARGQDLFELAEDLAIDPESHAVPLTRDEFGERRQSPGQTLGQSECRP